MPFLESPSLYIFYFILRRDLVPYASGYGTFSGIDDDLFIRHWHTIERRPHKSIINTLRPKQNGRHFADDTFKSIFVNENVRISIKIWLKFVPKGPINNIPALVQIMAWRRPGDKPLSEPIMVSLLTHICFTRPQWVNGVPVQLCHFMPEKNRSI